MQIASMTKNMGQCVSLTFIATEYCDSGFFHINICVATVCGRPFTTLWIAFVLKKNFENGCFVGADGTIGCFGCVTVDVHRLDCFCDGNNRVRAADEVFGVGVQGCDVRTHPNICVLRWVRCILSRRMCMVMVFGRNSAVWNNCRSSA